MIITVVNKYIVNDVPYLKYRTICNMHKNMDSESIITKLLPPQLYDDRDSLCFEHMIPVLISQFKKLFLMLTLIKYLSKQSYFITQQYANQLYSEIENETIARSCSDKQFACSNFVLEMHVTFIKRVVAATNILKLYCDSCLCVNILEFDCDILCRHFKLYERHDLAYKVISNIKFQCCHDVCATINNEIDNLKIKLMNTSDKIVMMLLGKSDMNSLTSLLCYDIIMLIINHLIHNVQDKWMKHVMIKNNSRIYLERGIELFYE